MEQEVSAFRGNASRTAALQKLCLPPVQENRILCKQDEKWWSSLVFCILSIKVEQTRRFQPGYASEAPEEFSEVHMQTISFPLPSWVGPWKLYVLL